MLTISDPYCKVIRGHTLETACFGIYKQGYVVRYEQNTLRQVVPSSEDNQKGIENLTPFYSTFSIMVL